MKRISWGVVLISFLAMMPVVLWCLFGWRALSWDVIARWAGLAGLTLLSVNVILSARLKLLGRLFHGLDKMYCVHHIIGCLTLLSLLLHANLLILINADISLLAGYKFITNTSDLGLIAGRFGLLTLVSAMIVVLYFKVKYQWFILAQRIMGVVVFIGGYHALFVQGSDVRRITPLFIYMSLIGGLAAVVYIYRSIFHHKFHKTFDYIVESIDLKGLVTVIYLSPVKEKLQYYAGQFAFVTFYSGGVPTEQHPFTISSGSSEGNLIFSIKQVGDYTSLLPKLKPGDIAKIDGPYGQFSYMKIGGTHQTWIAGGIGITPFLSMARSLSSHIRIDLYYSVRQPHEAIFLDELKEIAAQNRSFNVIPVYTDKGGLLTAEAIKTRTGLGKEVLLCGPPIMMKSLKKQLVALGVKKSNIHHEEFSLS